ncbi:MAG: molybdopterin-dependent oxidoreductase [Ignavibacteria bacterium]|nr:molybdopterin-dependent oxidoreductase [Ignavibacteria bacterium]
MKNYDMTRHVRGESLFADDFIVPEGTLYASVFDSSIAHGKILSIDISEAEKFPGVKKVILAQDIPGQNQIGGIIQDEPLLAENEVHFCGQPIAIVLAESLLIAREAKKKIKIEYKELTPITDAREAYAKGMLIIPPRIFSNGNVEEAFKHCGVVVEGKIETGAQEHLYLETQGAIAFPTEGNGIKIISSTQGPTATQRAACKVLGLPMHQVEVDVMRLGGGFGGKEDQANAWAAMAAVSAFLIKKTVKLILPRQEDMRMTGKRHPYSADFKMGLSNDGKILAYEVTFFQNAGAAADLSTAILDRTLFHATNSYFVPNVKATGLSCRTNLPPNTAFRGFGGPQAMFTFEAAIQKAADKLGVAASVIQEKNLLKEKDEFHYGQLAENSKAQACWFKAKEKFHFDQIKKNVDTFNTENKIYKKGFACMPICFGISFTNTFMNQAGALVHIYSDGSVGVSTAAVEMGQGVNEKIRLVAAEIFSIDKAKIKVETTNTTRVANTSPTAASSAADLNGKATELACKNLAERLMTFIKEELNFSSSDRIAFRDEQVYCNDRAIGLTWTELIQKAFFTRVNLSAQAHYAVPGIYFDKEKNKGKAFAYYSFGTAVVEVTVDCIRGTYVVDSVKAVHDFGKSFANVIDRGQAEGAIMQGIGWMTMEEIIYNTDGKLLTDALSTYKVPDIHSAPKEIEVHFLENSDNPLGIFNSKAIGEPPLMYGIGTFFALQNAMKAFRPEKEFEFSAPLTPEKVLLSLYKE